MPSFKVAGIQERRPACTLETGIFQALMAIELTNDGPVTILLDSEKLF